MDHGPSKGPQQWITARLGAHSNGSRPLCGPTAMDHGPSRGPQRWITAPLWARSNGSRPLCGPPAMDHGPICGSTTSALTPQHFTTPILCFCVHEFEHSATPTVYCASVPSDSTHDMLSLFTLGAY